MPEKATSLRSHTQRMAVTNDRNMCSCTLFSPCLNYENKIKPYSWYLSCLCTDTEIYSSAIVSLMRSVHPPKLFETWYGRLSILHARAQREKERMSFYLLPASGLLQDACQLRQSTAEGSKPQKIKTCQPHQQCQDWDIKPKYGLSAESSRKVIFRQC